MAQPASMQPFAELRQVAGALWSWRRFLLVNTGIITALSLLIAVLLPKWYRATTTLLPPQEDDAGFSLTTMIRGLTVPGVRIPMQVSPAEIYVAILHSRTVLVPIAEEFNYREVYGKRELEDVLRELHKHLYAEIGENGLVVLRVEDRDPQRAAAVANRMVALLDQFNRSTRSTRGQRARIFIEERLLETAAALRAAEDSLRMQQQTSKSLLLSREEAGSAEFGARLLSERIALQVRVGMAQSYLAEGSPELARMRSRLAELDQQIQKLPALGVELARLYREVKIQEEVFALLTAQLEEAKITEAKDVPTVEVLDPAFPPKRKARPKRAVIVLLGFVSSVVLGVGFVLVTESVRGARHHG
jgi:uncharacterized protein involved in exopolysaccharide biosynthesis